MGAEQHRVFFAKLADQLAGLDDLDWVDTNGWLVQDEDIRLMEDRLGDSGALPVSL